MVTVPQEFFDKAGVKRVCGFEFKYAPDNPRYGIGVVTDGTIPPLANLEEAARVGRALQQQIFGVAPEPMARLHWD